MDDDFMLADTFDSEFAEDRLEKHVSNYSFDDLMEM
jgi:hypothetical protein